MELKHSGSQLSLNKLQKQTSQPSKVPSIVSSNEILIDSILKDGNDQYQSLLGKKNRVTPSDTFDIQVGEVRFTQYYELKGSLFADQTPWWKRIFRFKKPINHLTKLQMIEMKQRALLKDFVNETQGGQISLLQILWQRFQALPLIEPDSTFYLCWQILNSIIVFFFFFEIPFITFFPVELSYDESDTGYIFWILIFAIIVFIVDIVVSLNTAIYVQGILETNRKTIINSYFKNCFILDIIPTAILCLQFKQEFILFNYTGILFYLKIYEIFKLQGYLYNNLRLKRKSIAIYSLTSLMIWIIFICHVFACIFYGVGKMELQRDDSQTWLKGSQLRGDIYLLKLPEQYSYAFYWSVTTMISVGYGDITPKNQPEVLVTVFTMFVSCILFAYSINAIWEIIRELNENRDRFDKHVTAMYRFMYDHGVSHKLNTKISAYLAHMWDADRKRDVESENIMIKKLAPALREELMYDTYGRFLQVTPFFYENFSSDFLKELSLEIEEVRYSEGEIIFMQDDPAWDDRSLYFIADGSVMIFAQRGNAQPHVLTTLHNYQSFGWVGFVGGVQRTASAKCLSYTTLYKLNRQKFLNRIDAYTNDKQVFYSLRDNYLLYNRINKFGLKCYVCESTFHLAEKCNKTHYLPTNLEQAQSYRANNIRNTTYSRRTRIRFNARKRQRECAREAKYMKRFTRDFDDESDRISQGEEETEQELQEIPRSKVATEDSNSGEEMDWDVTRQTGHFQSVQNQEFISLQPLSSSVLLDDQQKANPEKAKDPTPKQIKRRQKNFGRKSTELEEKPVSRTRKNTLQGSPMIDFKAENENTPLAFQLQSPQPIPSLTNISDSLPKQRQKGISEQLGDRRSIFTMLQQQTANRQEKVEEIKEIREPREQFRGDYSKVIKKLKQLSERLAGGNLIILNEIRDMLEAGTKMEENDSSMTESVSEQSQDFSIDMQYNYSNYFPENNPKNVIHKVKKVYKKTRKTLMYHM